MCYVSICSYVNYYAYKVIVSMYVYIGLSANVRNFGL